MPPILRLDIPEHRGEVDVKTAYVPGLDGFAIKISPGFFDNPKLGLPSTNGMMVLLSAKTGLVRRCCWTTAISPMCGRPRPAPSRPSTCRPDAASPRSSAPACRRGCSSRRCAGAADPRGADLGARCGKARSRGELDPERSASSVTGRVIDPQAAQDRRRYHRHHDTHPKADPEAEWLEPGQHITAMGSDAEHKNEIDPAAIAGRLYVADRLSQTRRLGELHHAIAAGLSRCRPDFRRTRPGDRRQARRARTRSDRSPWRPHRHRHPGHGHRQRSPLPARRRAGAGTTIRKLTKLRRKREET
jgi:ornithine cyclodeaminase